MPTWRLDDLDGVCQSVSDDAALRAVLQGLVELEPRVVEVEINANEYMHIGIGGRWAFVEHLVLEPWKAQVATGTGTDRPSSLRFLWCGARDTEILATWLMPASDAIELVVDVFRTGALPDSVEWELV